MSTTNLADIERRPETSKCSRSQMRRNIIQSQQQNRVRPKVNEVKPTQNVITLEQYFKGVNFKVVEIEEEDWDSDLQTQQNEINKFSLVETKNNNFRISRTNTKGSKRNKTNAKEDQQVIGVQDYLSGRGDASQVKRQVGNSMGPNYKQTPHYSQMNFYQGKVQGSPNVQRNKQDQDKEYGETKAKQLMATSKDFFGSGDPILRRTNYDKDKLLKIKQQVDSRFQQEDQQLLTKYAAKFNIYQEPARQSYTLKEIYGKLK